MTVIVVCGLALIGSQSAGSPREFISRVTSGEGGVRPGGHPLEGTWKYTFAEISGKKDPPDVLAKQLFIIKGTTATMLVDGKAVYHFKDVHVNTSTKPYRVSWTRLPDNHAGLLIWHKEGNKLTWSGYLDKAEYPTMFSGGPGMFLAVLEHVKN
jgi:uncharacterized protein (TIGR03067 family)